MLKSDPDADGVVWYRCADCGVSAHAAAADRTAHRALCFCGARMPDGSGFALRCHVNESKSLQMPEEVVAVGVETQPPIRGSVRVSNHH